MEELRALRAQQREQRLRRVRCEAGFYEAWENGGATWERVKIDATQCPRISAEFLAEERRAMPETYFRQEYLCDSIATMDQAFGAEFVMRAITSEVRPLFTGEKATGLAEAPRILSPDVKPLFRNGSPTDTGA